MKAIEPVTELPKYIVHFPDMSNNRGFICYDKDEVKQLLKTYITHVFIYILEDNMKVATSLQMLDEIESIPS